MVVNNYDFGGWATVANKRCSDGRTIMKDAFIDNDGTQVPLVWNHQHTEVDNVLGHALLENRPEGVYAYCTFNDSESGKMGRELVKHGDVNQLSIYANQLKQQGGNVVHGVIREVSLVLAGANPGAYIDTIMYHSDDSDEAGIIFTGEDIVLAHGKMRLLRKRKHSPMLAIIKMAKVPARRNIRWQTPRKKRRKRLRLKSRRSLKTRRLLRMCSTPLMKSRSKSFTSYSLRSPKTPARPMMKMTPRKTISPKI